MNTIDPPNGREFIVTLEAVLRFLRSSEEIFPETRADIESGLMIAMTGALRWAAEDAMFAEQPDELRRSSAN